MSTILRTRGVLWSGIWTGNDSWNTTFSDLNINESGMGVGVGIYLEHFSLYDTFTNFLITGANTGINSEWNDGTVGNEAGQFNTIENGTINATGATNTTTAGVYLDAGTNSTTITGVTFENQTWAAIGDYENIGTNNFSNNTYDLAPGAVDNSTDHI